MFIDAKTSPSLGNTVESGKEQLIRRKREMDREGVDCCKKFFDRIEPSAPAIFRIDGEHLFCLFIY